MICCVFDETARVAATTEQRRLIINADDFGLAPGVNAGIVEAHCAGAVTSTSMMVRCPGWSDALARLPKAPRLGVGLHFNLVLGTPLTRAASLIDTRTGDFRPLGLLVQRSLLGVVRMADIESECEAQLDALRGAGVVPTHIDSHRHTHALPVIRNAVARVAVHHKLPLRRPKESLRHFATDLPAVVKRAIVSTAWTLTSIAAPRTPSTDYFTGIALQGATDFERRLTLVLGDLPRGTSEVMVHPGHVDQTLESIDGYTTPRERELAALTSAGVLRALRVSTIRRITFAEL